MSDAWVPGFDSPHLHVGGCTHTDQSVLPQGVLRVLSLDVPVVGRNVRLAASGGTLLLFLRALGAQVGLHHLSPPLSSFRKREGER